MNIKIKNFILIFFLTFTLLIDSHSLLFFNNTILDNNYINYVLNIYI